MGRTNVEPLGLEGKSFLRSTGWKKHFDPQAQAQCQPTQAINLFRKALHRYVRHLRSARTQLVRSSTRVPIGRTAPPDLGRPTEAHIEKRGQAGRLLSPTHVPSC